MQLKQKHLIIGLVCVLHTGHAENLIASEKVPSLIPVPPQMSLKDGSFLFAADTVIHFKGNYTIRMENCKSGGWKSLGDVKMKKE